MQVSVTGRHVSLGPEVREYVEEKAAKLTRYYDRVHSVDVVVERESGEMNTEMLVHADHGTRFVAQQRGDNVAASIDSVTDKIERQLRKHKERLRSHKHQQRVAEQPEPEDT